MEQLAAQDLGDLIDLERYQLDDPIHLAAVKARLDREGVVILPDFLRASARDVLVLEAEKQAENAFFTTSTHNVYLTSQDQSLPAEHIVNRQIKSSKGCITTDQIPEGSGLKTLYHNPQFQNFITAVLGEKALYAYADPLSSINVHYAHEGQELGWHFDNSSFAITLLLQAPEGGGVFEYVPDLRDAAAGEMNFQGVADVLEGATPVKTLDMQPGTLVLFRGRNSLHRVTPTAGNRTRLLVVLAYNDAPGVSLSEGARMTFYGRVGT